ncbi:Retrotransposon gag protein [Gossypium australe]|uniref:Retrotransposon gag protein n=1 Tax=Gossypium australe TaxID=47621 RepID=A0A5B6UW48_9ROSI|nr:Retrotransposon gag protein [Gossypium australe]
MTSMLKNIIGNGCNTNMIGQQPSQFENITIVHQTHNLSTMWETNIKIGMKPQLAESSSNLEHLLEAYMAKNDATIRNLENQMGHDTKNPKSIDKEHCKLFTLKGGKVLEPKVVEAKGEPIVVQNRK